MASTTVTASTAPSSSLNPRRSSVASLSGSAAPPSTAHPPTASQSSAHYHQSASSSFTSMQPPQMASASQQSQQGSQQSFSMSQSSAQNANHSQTSVYRQYTDPPRRPNDNVMPIYSVRPSLFSLFLGVNADCCPGDVLGRQCLRDGGQWGHRHAPTGRQLAQCHADPQGGRCRQGTAHQGARKGNPDGRARKGPGRLRQIPGNLDPL